LNIRKIIGFAIGPIGVAFLGSITLPLTAWFFTTDDIGRIAFLQIIIAFSTMLFGLGLDQAYVREYHERSNKKKLWKQTALPGLYLLLIVSFLMLLDPNLLSSWMFGEQSLLFTILVIILFITNYLIRFFSLILRMQEKAFLFSMSQLWPKIINIVVLLGFVLVFNFNNFIHLLYALVISNVVACIFFVWNTRKEWMNFEDNKIDLDQIKPLVKFGMPLVAGGLAFWGLNSIDRLFLKHYSSYSELGIYSIATSFAAIAIILQSVFSTVWAPTVYKWVKEDKNLEKIHDITWYLVIIIAFIFSLVGTFSSLISLVLPEQYNIVQYIVLPALAAPLLYTLSETTVVGIGISRKSYLSLCASFGAFFSAVILNYIMTSKLGALGASISSCLAFLIFFILRTELSVIAWKSFPRLRVYCVVVIMVGLAILNATVQDRFFWLFKIIWFFILILSSFGIYRLILQYKASREVA